MYFLIDVSNGGAAEIETAAKIYMWKFKTLKSAQKFLKKHKKGKHAAKLVGPFNERFVVRISKENADYICLEATD